MPAIRAGQQSVEQLLMARVTIEQLKHEIEQNAEAQRLRLALRDLRSDVNRTAQMLRVCLQSQVR
jgi:hypothetical protein